jgi:putative redox protein
VAMHLTRFKKRPGLNWIQMEALGPKALLLSGLAGCSAIDVVDVLEKMRVSFTHLKVDAEAEQTEEHPRVFKDIQLTYFIAASEEARDKIIKAIELSLDKYCGVAAMLKKNSAIHYTLIIEAGNG